MWEIMVELQIREQSHEKKINSQTAFFNSRVVITLTLWLTGALLALAGAPPQSFCAWDAPPSRHQQSSGLTYAYLWESDFNQPEFAQFRSWTSR